MPEPIQVRYAKGLHLPELDLWLDPHRAKPIGFVSHAHADHFAKHGTILCSARTHALIKARYGTGKSKVIPLAYGERYDLNEDYHLHLLPAGHIFGSAQLHLTRKSDGATLLYSGDFKLRESFAAETIEMARADTLIMETTFGLPRFQFPPTAEVAAKMVRFCRETLEAGEIPMLLGYSLGKAQEILAALEGAGMPIMVHRTVAEMTAVYEAFGVGFPPYERLDVDRAEGHVLVLPPNVVRSEGIRDLRRTRRTMLSGWALNSGAHYRYGANAVLPLSDHADYPDLMRYVDHVQPRYVYTLHGYAAEFARDLREKGIEAWSILEDNQMDLGFAVDRDTGEPEDRTMAERVPCGVAELADVNRRVAETAGERAIVSLLEAYFRGLEACDLSPAASLLSGAKIVRDMPSVRQVLMKLSGLTRTRFRDVVQTHGGLMGRAAFTLLKGRTSARALSLGALRSALHGYLDARDPVAKEKALMALLGELHPCEGRVVVEILMRELPQEGLLEAAVAKAFAQPVSEVQVAHQLLGNLGEVAVRAKQGRLDGVGMRPFVPVRPMRARRWSALEMREVVWLEAPVGGIRAHLHVVGERAALFSADRRSLDHEFPELCQEALSFSDEMVLDGVVVALAGDELLRPSDLKKRPGRRRLESDLFQGQAVPATFVVFDLLWHNGETLIDQSLEERRRRLESLLLPSLFSCAAVEKLSWDDACARDYQGWIAKDPKSPYALGGREKA